MSQLQTTQDRKVPAQRVEFVVPAVDLHQDADGFTLEVEMPGVDKPGVGITFEDGKLTLVGHRRAPAVSGRAVYSESGNRDYRLVFDLDPTVDAGGISAAIEQGLLRVRLPKAEASKPRKISVA